MEALHRFALANGFPVPARYLYLRAYDELIANDLLVRYSWTASDAGTPFDDWPIEDQREMLEVMKQIRLPVIVKLAATPTAKDAMTGRGSPVHDDGEELPDVR